jgi:hypothetical protein
MLNITVNLWRKLRDTNHWSNTSACGRRLAASLRGSGATLCETASRTQPQRPGNLRFSNEIALMERIGELLTGFRKALWIVSMDEGNHTHPNRQRSLIDALLGFHSLLHPQLGRNIDIVEKIGSKCRREILFGQPLQSNARHHAIGSSQFADTFAVIELRESLPQMIKLMLWRDESCRFGL